MNRILPLTRVDRIDPATGGGNIDAVQDRARCRYGRRTAWKDHLGALAAVKLFTDDGQIREISYREERAQEPKYQVRIWRLDNGRA